MFDILPNWSPRKPTIEPIGASRGYCWRRSCRRDKSVATLDLNRYAAPLRGKIRELLRGEFLAGATNVCLIGRPGTGKSHVMAALARALVEAGHPVLFTPVAQLVERLLEAKKNLRLARELKRLDNFECIALDDIGYVQHDRTEMEVLFALAGRAI